jgi:hypothetical protein
LKCFWATFVISEKISETKEEKNIFVIIPPISLNILSYQCQRHLKGEEKKCSKTGLPLSALCISLFYRDCCMCLCGFRLIWEKIIHEWVRERILNTYNLSILFPITLRARSQLLIVLATEDEIHSCSTEIYFKWYFSLHFVRQQDDDVRIHHNNDNMYKWVSRF